MNSHKMAFPMDDLSTKGNMWRSENSSLQKKNSFDGIHKWPKTLENDLLLNAFHKPQSNHRNNDNGDLEEIQEYFNKKFQFDCPVFGWNLPLESKMFTENKWQIERFLELKKNLNEVKNKLNNYNLDEWHKHTRAMNKAGSLAWTVKKEITPEFVTQAWLKFYEICSSYNFVSKEAQKRQELNSVHLCEAPGAFITSLNHYLKLNHPKIKWDWISTTLNPYHEENPLSIMINDDRFILHTLDHWKFGEDFTGNLMNINNMLHLSKEAAKMGPVQMITADGSIDCQNDPGEQENYVSQLVYCEVVCALHILEKGGNFVVKMFTMYEEATICLMYLLACSFQSINVCKPSISKEGNSENYVVCLNYKGNTEMEPWLRVLEAHYGSERLDKSMFAITDIPEEFLDMLYNCAKTFMKYQVAVIERNIYLFEAPNNQQSVNKTKRLRKTLSEEYIRRFNLRPLESKKDQIVGEDELSRTVMPNIDKRWEEGSFNDKIKREKMSPLEKKSILLHDLEKMQIQWEFEEDIKWLEFPIYGNNFKVVIGKSVKSVHSSKFCSGRLLKIRNDIRKLTKEYFPHIYQTNDSPKSNARASNELSAPVKCIIQKSFSLVESKVRVLNYKEKLWESLESGQNECFESNAFFDIMDEIDEKIWRGYSLIIQGYPMLTQFTAGVIYLMGHLFEKVGFVRPTGQDFAVIFQEFRSRNHKMFNFVEELDSKMEIETKGDKSVLSLIPIKDMICGHKEFYSCVTAVNNLCVKEQICDIAQRLPEA